MVYGIRNLGVIATAIFGLCGAAVAQDGNNIIVSQSGEGNSLRVDQSTAQNSLVGGVPESTDFGLELDPANQGSFLVYGDVSGAAVGNTLSIVSDSSAALQSGVGNSADVTLSGSGTFAGLRQVGDENIAVIDVGGDNLFTANAGGIIVQEGDGNSGTVNVSGENAFGELIQLGNNNDTAFNVTSPNSNVSFTVQGDNTNNQQLPASVATTSGGQITIVQRQLGSFSN